MTISISLPALISYWISVCAGRSLELGAGLVLPSAPVALSAPLELWLAPLVLLGFAFAASVYAVMLWPKRGPQRRFYAVLGVAALFLCLSVAHLLQFASRPSFDFLQSGVRTFFYWFGQRFIINVALCLGLVAIGAASVRFTRFRAVQGVFLGLVCVQSALLMAAWAAFGYAHNCSV